MKWTYQISAAARPRVLERIAQVFEQQMISMQRLVLEQSQGKLAMNITVEVEEGMARRVHAKLYKQIDVLDIRLMGEDANLMAEDAALSESSE